MLLEVLNFMSVFPPKLKLMLKKNLPNLCQPHLDSITLHLVYLSGLGPCFA